MGWQKKKQEVEFETYRIVKENTMAADDLVIQLARASVAMILIIFSWNIPASALAQLIHWGVGTHMCQYTMPSIPSLVQAMARRLIGAKPLSEPILEYC